MLPLEMHLREPCCAICGAPFKYSSSRSQAIRGISERWMERLYVLAYNKHAPESESEPSK